MSNYSLSWFKKRTAEYNKRYGTHLSPTELWRNQNRSDTAALLLGVKDPRPVKSATLAAEKSASYTEAANIQLRNTWQAFANANNFAQAVLNGVGYSYISPSRGRIYFRGGDAVYSTNPRTGETREIAEIPRDAQFIDVKLAQKLLAQKAKEVKSTRRNHPFGYRTE